MRPRVYGRPLEHPDAERERLERLGIRDELVDELASLAAAQYRSRRKAERRALRRVDHTTRPDTPSN